MKILQTAPAFESLFKEIFDQPDRFALALASCTGPTVQGQYLHWDQVRRREPLAGLSHAEWWFALKWHRQGGKAIPLQSKEGPPFHYSLPDPITERLHEIDLGAGGQIAMPDPITNPETRDQYYVSSLIEEAITSSQLEGATTTRQVAKAMLRAGREPRDRSERMILNTYLTMRKIGELREEDLSPDLIFELHRIVTDGTLDDDTAAGRFRRSDEQIFVEGDRGEVVHVPPPADELEARMAAMCLFANDSAGAFTHPAIRSILLHFWLAYDHPFVDGNGRTARALFYWSMLRHRYWLFEYISISHSILKAPTQYALAFLHAETDSNDATYFVLYHLDVIRRAIHDLHTYIERRTEQLKQIEVELRGVNSLNHRQRALISHALRHPHADYTISSHRTSHNVVYQTARTDLLELERRGLLRSNKRGKKLVFRPVEDIQKHLGHLE